MDYGMGPQTLSDTGREKLARDFPRTKKHICMCLTKQLAPAGNTSTSSPSPKLHVGAIAGGTVGSAAFVILVVLAVFYYCRRCSSTVSEDAKMASTSLNPSQNTSSAPLKIFPCHDTIARGDAEPT
ncbi:hypothetical protein BT96DRAFT_989370 [Gymnopus androsaceus JB14]|uniref:Uncharacterized protein n=1 Tax=Gymnopus androsaceus JB14 TaxID=1447944 RepID=A0A6A4I4F4_9AGAR|nr:hypothetical protein BT96DRAFT_989370 [Gymnopus androsaceus JB14]